MAFSLLFFAFPIYFSLSFSHLIFFSLLWNFGNFLYVEFSKWRSKSKGKLYAKNIFRFSNFWLSFIVEFHMLKKMIWPKKYIKWKWKFHSTRSTTDSAEKRDKIEVLHESSDVLWFLCNFCSRFFWFRW